MAGVLLVGGTLMAMPAIPVCLKNERANPEAPTYRKVMGVCRSLAAAHALAASLLGRTDAPNPIGHGLSEALRPICPRLPNACARAAWASGRPHTNATGLTRGRARQPAAQRRMKHDAGFT